MLNFKQLKKTKIAEEKAIKRVFCLYRVSTKGQVDKDDIPMQKQACREFAKRQSCWIIQKEYMEKGISGFKVSAENRDAMIELKEAAERKEFDVLLVFMFDRLGRRQDETPFLVEWFTNQGIEVWSTKEGQQRFESEADYLVNFMRFWQAGGESRKTSIRVKTRMHQLTEQGMFTGGVAPFGYKLVKSGVVSKKGRELMALEVVPYEAEMVKYIFEKTVNEGYGTYVLAEYINSKHMLTHNNSKFQSNTIRRILANPIYCGYYVRGDAVSPQLEHLQIIDENMFSLAQRVLDSRKIKSEEKKRVSARTKSSTMLSGNLYCAHCGCRMTSTSFFENYKTKDGTKKRSERRYRYLCPGKAMHRNDCNGQSTYVAKTVDNAVIDIMNRYFELIKATPRSVALEAKYKAELETSKREIKQLEKEIEMQKRKLGELTEEIANALIGESKFTPDVLSVAIDKAKQKISKSTALISEKKSKFDDQEKEFSKLDYYYEQFISWANEFGTASIERKRMIVSLMFKEIIVGKGYEIEMLLDTAYGQFFQDEDIMKKNATRGKAE